jgi:hypothetical protein
MLAYYRYIEPTSKGFECESEHVMFDPGQVALFDSDSIALKDTSLKTHPEWFEFIGPASCDDVRSHEELLAKTVEIRDWLSDPFAREKGWSKIKEVVFQRIRKLAETAWRIDKVDHGRPNFDGLTEDEAEQSARAWLNRLLRKLQQDRADPT